MLFLSVLYTINILLPIYCNLVFVPDYCVYVFFNPLTPNDHYSGRTAPLPSKYCILYIYSTNIGTKYFKHGIHSLFSYLQNVVYFIILTYLVPVLFKFYIQGVLKLKKNYSDPKTLKFLYYVVLSLLYSLVLRCCFRTDCTQTERLKDFESYLPQIRVTNCYTCLQHSNQTSQSVSLGITKYHLGIGITAAVRPSVTLSTSDTHSCTCQAQRYA